MAKEEEAKTAKAHSDYKLITFWITIAVMLALSMGLINFLLDAKGKYGEYFYINPFAHNAFSRHYLRTYYWFPITTLIITFITRAFFFGNPKKKYISKLENIKRKILMFIPLYIDGEDSRNNYIRFGMEKSFKYGFLERRIQQGHYLEKVRHLSIFIRKMSPDHILNLRSDYIPNTFISRTRYVEIFKIIEGYLKKNIDAVQNIHLQEYSAIGTKKAYLTNASIREFIKQQVSSTKVKSYKYTKKEAQVKFEKLLTEIKKQPKKAQQKLKKEFLMKLTNGKLQNYNNFINKMVIFSPLALKEYIALIESEGIRFLKQHTQLKTSLLKKINEYSEIDEKYFIEILKFVTFYKIINYFLGLPSGIVTARIEDYTLSRIIDDIELFEKNTAIRQIKPYINDKRGKYDDTNARAYMIFHHEFMNNSKYCQVLKTLETRFDALKDITNDNTYIELPTFEGAEDEKLQYIKSHQIDDGWVYKPIEEEER